MLIKEKSNFVKAVLKEPNVGGRNIDVPLRQHRYTFYAKTLLIVNVLYLHAEQLALKMIYTWTSVAIGWPIIISGESHMHNSHEFGYKEGDLFSTLPFLIKHVEPTNTDHRVTIEQGSIL